MIIDLARLRLSRQDGASTICDVSKTVAELSALQNVPTFRIKSIRMFNYFASAARCTISTLNTNEAHI